jgi:hypothetical protein
MVCSRLLSVTGLTKRAGDRFRNVFADEQQRNEKQRNAHNSEFLTVQRQRSERSGGAE